MAHFAKLNNDNVVTDVLSVSNVDLHFLDYPESEGLGIQICRDVTGHQKWKQTSYNNNFRGRYGAIGFTYDEAKDIFIPEQPFSSWVFNESTVEWEAPIAFPSNTDSDNAEEMSVFWDEDNNRWTNQFNTYWNTETNEWTV
tara:strand:+ start:820 stop:1242 length:423 start_codon:yes stop_codon:yes gene_type:complete